MAVNNFDVLKEMGKRNGKIQLAPLGNLIGAKATKQGTQVTIGVAGNVCAGITFGEYVGGLILADKKEFEALKAELERAEESDRAARTDCMCRYCSGHLADPGTLHIPCDSQNCTCECQRLKAAARGEGSDGKSRA